MVNQNSGFQGLMDGKGKSFAFNNPELNIGKPVPAYWLVQQKEEPEEFLAK